MRIKFIEVQNFRRLKSIRIDLSEDKTLFVGANNSGKTTAMVALRRFLIEQRSFDIHDFTISSWKKINIIGNDWELQNTNCDLADWEESLPTMDVWLDVGLDEIHYVQHLLPTLDWEGGLLGVRLRLEPLAIEILRKEYLSVRQHAVSTIAAAKKIKGSHEYSVPLWPVSMKEFLSRGFSSKFVIRSYILDPKKLVSPKAGAAQLQELSPDAEFIESNPFAGLIRIDEINAQRGFSDAGNSRDVSYDRTEESVTRGDRRKLSEQLRSYYSKHLDPTEMPESHDVHALEAIYQAQTIFDQKLETCFSEALKEIQNLGYPGISDPKLTVSTRINPMDGLHHPSALQYDVISNCEGSDEIPLRLPEQYNGLGYQNLISMVFRLMSFRDEWMQVGKIAKKIAAIGDETFFPPPLHLILVEEPEAHLHVQVQQVFFRKAFEILRNHPDLKSNKSLTTQLVVSTHSSHIAHECEFECLRYFCRRSAGDIGDVPTSVVINLSEVFGKQDQTAKFVSRYLRASHCDLFFADAAIFVEGSAERMLIPHFIRENFPELNRRYLTLLEVGGSHAHRFRPLVEHLGLTTLIITDIDAAENTGKHRSVPISFGSSQITRNMTLKDWLPTKTSIDELLSLADFEKSKTYKDENYSVRVAYQTKVKVTFATNTEPTEIAANTFEDAFVYENIDYFRALQDGGGFVEKINEIVTTVNTTEGLAEAMFKALKNSNSNKKAEFALDLLYSTDPKVFRVPTYINEGLKWLQDQVCSKEKELLCQNLVTSEIVLLPTTELV